MAAVSAPGAARLSPRVHLWPSVPRVKERRSGSSAPAAVSTQPQDQAGGSQRWAGGTLAATPKIIPCPGSPVAAEPASSLSTSLTLSDSDEPTERSRGRQVKGLKCQVEFPVTAREAAMRVSRSIFRAIIFKN